MLKSLKYIFPFLRGTQITLLPININALCSTCSTGTKVKRSNIEIPRTWIKPNCFKYSDEKTFHFAHPQSSPYNNFFRLLSHLISCKTKLHSWLNLMRGRKKYGGQPIWMIYFSILQHTAEELLNRMEGCQSALPFPYHLVFHLHEKINWYY